jgi:hypothetical protein
LGEKKGGMSASMEKERKRRKNGGKRKQENAP